MFSVPFHRAICARKTSRTQHSKLHGPYFKGIVGDAYSIENANSA
ncbi:hypothetical protein RBWH47_04722 [Rhodopirellula baltica WH47]|uniref:Uncharacterized protein n=1 Tax=Rhodopirellula baltica WH47 TaxID=991778 RepID=F2AML9_RHOBT|nr:hypothetical protein RBWH47_04722 [Rhodopirellula baltica WH47]